MIFIISIFALVLGYCIIAWVTELSDDKPTDPIEVDSENELECITYQNTQFNEKIGLSYVCNLTEEESESIREKESNIDEL